MNLTQKLLSFTLLGAEWVLWLLIGLSIASVGIMIERFLYYRSLNLDFEALADGLRRRLAKSDFEGARKLARETNGVEAEVALAGLTEVERGVDAVAAAMMGAKSRTKLKLERNLAFLGTLGSNAPFIGLFGTVIGVVQAFAALGEAAKTPLAGAAGASQMAPQAVMSSIAEALVATAVGLIVAIPAVAFNNLFQRLIKSTLANTEALTRILMGYLKTPGAATSPYRASAKDDDEPEPAKPAKGKSAKKPEKKADDEESQ